MPSPCGFMQMCCCKRKIGMCETFTLRASVSSWACGRLHVLHLIALPRGLCRGGGWALDALVHWMLLLGIGWQSL